MGTAVRGLLVAAGEGHTAVGQGGMHGGLRRAGKQGVGCAHYQQKALSPWCSGLPEVTAARAAKCAETAASS